MPTTHSLRTALILTSAVAALALPVASSFSAHGSGQAAAPRTAATERTATASPSRWQPLGTTLRRHPSRFRIATHSGRRDTVRGIRGVLRNTSRTSTHRRLRVRVTIRAGGASAVGDRVALLLRYRSATGRPRRVSVSRSTLTVGFRTTTVTAPRPRRGDRVEVDVIHMKARPGDTFEVMREDVPIIAAAANAVSVSPGSVRIAPAQSVVFAATVAGSAGKVTWSIESPGGDRSIGSISSSGRYTAPSAAPRTAWVTIRATTRSSPRRTGTATVEIVDPGASAASAGGFGFSIPGIEWTSRYADHRTPLDISAGMGARWVRFDLPWVVTEKVKGIYDFRVFDPIVDHARARGMQPLLILDYNNPLHSGSANLRIGPTTESNQTAFAAWARAAAAHFRGRVTAYEVWNEPNNPFWQPRADPVAFTRLLAKTYPAIKSVDPSITVVSGGLSPTYYTSDRTRIPADVFLDEMYSAGARGTFDALGHHPYWYKATMDGTVDHLGWKLMGTLRAIMERNGDGARAIWGTEYGAASPSATRTESQQADEYDLAMAAWRTYPWAGPLIFHTLRDQPDLEGDERTFGMLRADWTEKPSAAVFKRHS